MAGETNDPEKGKGSARNYGLFPTDPDRAITPPSSDFLNDTSDAALNIILGSSLAAAKQKGIWKYFASNPLTKSGTVLIEIYGHT